MPTAVYRTPNDNPVWGLIPTDEHPFRRGFWEPHPQPVMVTMRSWAGPHGPLRGFAALFDIPGVFAEPTVVMTRSFPDRYVEDVASIMRHEMAGNQQ
jgi:hypothetical protein